MRRLRENSLTLFFGAIFLAALLGQAVAGVALMNEEQVSAGLEPITIVEYVTTSQFAVDVTENWQSEFLQFLLYIGATVYLLQRGSPESKKLDEAGRESDEDQKVAEYSTDDSPAWARVRGWRLSVYSRSLGLVMGTIFLLSWLTQSVTGVAAYNEQQLRPLQAPPHGSTTCPPRTSGTAPCRTGSPSCWPSPPWPCSPST